MASRAWWIPVLAGLLAGCGNGIDTPGSPANTPAADDPAGDGRFVRFEKLEFNYNENSVLQLLFRSRDAGGEPVVDLRMSELSVKEDNEPVPASESLRELLPNTSLNYRLETAILLDVSNSISPTELAEMKHAVRTLFLSENGQSSTLLPRQHLAIYEFDDQVRKVVDFTSNTAVLAQGLENVSLSGVLSTNLYGALSTGAEGITNSYNASALEEGAVILITDGNDTANRSSLQAALSAIKGKAIFTIGVGAEADQETLKLLGTEGFVAVSSFTELNKAVEDVRNKLQRWFNSLYYLHYASPKRRAQGSFSNSQHQFSLSVINNSNSGADKQIVEKFNSYNFSDVKPQVVISGPRSLNVGQVHSFVAQTQWVQGNSVYQWTLNDAACEMVAQSGATVRIRATAAGSCSLLAIDLTHSASQTVLLTALAPQLLP